MVTIPTPPEHTEEGDEIPKAPPGSHLEQLMTLLEFCRIREFKLLGPVSIGPNGIAVQISDLRQLAGASRGEPDPGPWKDAGYEGDE